MSESGPGRIRLWNDFFAGLDKASEADATTTWDSYALGDFHFFGQGTLDVDSGAPVITGALSGAIRLTTTDETEHMAAVGTSVCWDVGLMGTIVMETRVQFNNTATKETFIGFDDEVDDVSILEGEVLTGATTTITHTASDFIGFYQSADLTATTAWHLVHRGGGVDSSTVSTTAESGIVAVAGEWQQLRLELDVNGTARWYINEELLKTQANAVSTTVNLGLRVAVEAKGNAIEELDVDYLLVKANRDWTV